MLDKVLDLKLKYDLGQEKRKADIKYNVSELGKLWQIYKYEYILMLSVFFGGIILLVLLFIWLL